MFKFFISRCSTHLAILCFRIEDMIKLEADILSIIVQNDLYKSESYWLMHCFGVEALGI